MDEVIYNNNNKSHTPSHVPVNGPGLVSISPQTSSSADNTIIMKLLFTNNNLVVITSLLNDWLLGSLNKHLHDLFGNVPIEARH